MPTGTKLLTFLPLCMQFHATFAPTNNTCIRMFDTLLTLAAHMINKSQFNPQRLKVP